MKGDNGCKGNPGLWKETRLPKNDLFNNVEKEGSGKATSIGVGGEQKDNRVTQKKEERVLNK